VLADVELEKRVKAALHADPYFYDEHVTVSVEQGAVVLRGFVFRIGIYEARFASPAGLLVTGVWSTSFQSNRADVSRRRWLARCLRRHPVTRAARTGRPALERKVVAACDCDTVGCAARDTALVDSCGHEAFCSVILTIQPQAIARFGRKISAEDRKIA
jgi:hypothetical protein